MKNIIFTDGSSLGNPGPGGYGAIILHKDEVIELGGREEMTTNNRMEMVAAIKALSYLLEIHHSTLDTIIIYTDSIYLIKGITEWIFGWQKKNWKNSKGEGVLNQDLWEKLFEVSRNFKIKWHHIKGHSGIAGNERCDEIATSFAAKDNIDLYNGPFKEYKINILKV